MLKAMQFIKFWNFEFFNNSFFSIRKSKVVKRFQKCYETKVIVVFRWCN